MRTSHTSLFVVSIIALLTLASCGDGGTTGSTPTTTTTTAIPAADIDVSANGYVTVHPSAVQEFGAAIEFPIRIQESGGGSAIWNFFRVSFLRGGVEIERSEQGATVIRNAGFRDIGPRQTVEPDVIARVNSTDWDDIRIMLGFIDKRDSRSFQRNLDLETFDGVAIDVTPVLLPDGDAFTIVETPDH